MTAPARAVVQFEQDGPLAIVEARIPAPGPHQVQIRMIASGICQSQIFWMNQGRQAPMLFGHEGYGVASAVGRGVTGIREGDHVLVTWLPRPDPAGRNPEVAGAELSSGETARSPNVFTWADHVVADELYVRNLPADAQDAVVSIVGCAVITGAGAVVNAAAVRDGATVAVFGAGGVGLCAVAAAKRAGAERIVAVDLHPSKLDLARRFGATDTVNARDGDPVAQIHRLLPGRCGCGPGVDVAFDCVGLTETTHQALGAAHAGRVGVERGGACVIVGIPKKPIELDLFGLMYAEKTLIGTLAGSCGQDQIDEFLAWYRDGTLDLHGLVTDRYPLERIGEAVEALSRGAIDGRAIVLM